MVCIGRVVKQVHGYNRRLTGKTWASRQNYRSRLLAIGKDSNVIGVRSSCLKRSRSDRKKGPRAQPRW